MKFTIDNYIQFDTFNDIKFAIKLHGVESQTVKCYHFHKYSAQCVVLFRLIYYYISLKFIKKRKSFKELQLLSRI